MFMRDFSAALRENLDLSADQSITRDKMQVVEDVLMCYTENGTVEFQGVGEQITLVGGIDRAIDMGILSIYGSWGGKG